MNTMDKSFLEMKKKLQQMPEKLQQRTITKATRQAAKVVEKEAKRLVPKDTGALELAIKTIKVPKRKTPMGHIQYLIMPVTVLKRTTRVKVNGEAAKMKTNIYTYYGHMVEYGTVKMAAQPFMRPAAENTLQESFDKFFEVVKKDLR